MGEMADYYLDQDIDAAMRECSGDMQFYRGPVTDELILDFPEVNLIGNQRRREEQDLEAISERRLEGLQTGEFWVDKDGRSISLKDISRTYAKNILNLLSGPVRRGKLVPKLEAIANGR